MHLIFLGHLNIDNGANIDSYAANYERFNKNHNSSMNITVTNDYTGDSMLKGCNKVIDMIIANYLSHN